MAIRSLPAIRSYTNDTIPNMPFELADSLGFQVNRVARAMAGELAAGIGDLGLTPVQWAVLHMVTRHPGEHQQQVTQRLGSDRATVAELVGRMRKRDLLRREPDPRDSRRQLLFPGPDAEDGRLVAAAEQVAAGINDRAMAGFSPAERSTLLALLRRVRANLADQEVDS